jgi:hypothetical protein
LDEIPGSVEQGVAASADLTWYASYLLANFNQRGYNPQLP